MLEAIKEELHWLHLELPKQNLVTWTSGNISARDSHSGLVVIKPWTSLGNKTTECP